MILRDRPFSLSIEQPEFGFDDDFGVTPSSGLARPMVEAPSGGAPAITAEDDAAPARATADEIDAALILRERPDVFAAYYTTFYGAHFDKHPSAWIDRVGGTSAEDFARYWYKAHGSAEGYSQGLSIGDGSAPNMAAIIGAYDTGRTTADGIHLAQILIDRPDVFRAFFTAYYGPNNDRNSHAWVNRVGGETVEDFANYWYETYGRFSYTPSTQAPPVEPETDTGPAVPLVIQYNEDGTFTLVPETEADPAKLTPPGQTTTEPPVVTEPPADDPAPETPATDGPVTDQPTPTGSETPVEDPPPVEEPPLETPAPSGMEMAIPLVVHVTEDGGLELLPATPEELVQLQAGSLFDGVI